MTVEAPGIVARRIRHLRRQYGLTQPEFAARVGVSASIVSFWERGERQPVAPTIIRICAAFWVSADWLLGLENFEE